MGDCHVLGFPFLTTDQFPPHCVWEPWWNDCCLKPRLEVWQKSVPSCSSCLEMTLVSFNVDLGRSSAIRPESKWHAWRSVGEGWGRHKLTVKTCKPCQGNVGFLSVFKLSLLYQHRPLIHRRKHMNGIEIIVLHAYCVGWAHFLFTRMLYKQMLSDLIWLFNNEKQQ